MQTNAKQWQRPGNTKQNQGTVPRRAIIFQDLKDSGLLILQDGLRFKKTSSETP